MGVSIFPEVGLPPGMVMSYAGAVAPDGWLVCNGGSLLRADYPALFAAIGTTYGLGTDTTTNTTFALPNLKGRVIVGVDAGQTEFDLLGEVGGVKTVTLTQAEMPVHAHTATVSVTVAGTGAVNTGDNNRGHTHAMETHKHSFDHWHSAAIGNVKAWSGLQHEHVSAGGYAAEGANTGSSGAGAIPVNVDGTGGINPQGAGGTGYDVWHTGGQPGQSQNHVHGYEHGHTGSGSATIANAGSGGAHQNLQPYMTMNYLIKT